MTATQCQSVICCRYEKTAFQKEVQQRFDALQDSSWTVLDASRSIEDLQLEVSVCWDGDCTGTNVYALCHVNVDANVDACYHELGRAYTDPYPSLSTWCIPV